MQVASMNVVCFMWWLEDVIFPKSVSLLWNFFTRHVHFFFETSALKEVRILRYLHNKSAVLILMPMLSSKIKLSYTILYIFDFFYDKVFYTLYFLLFDIFFYKWVFLKNTKHLKACFYIELLTFNCRTFTNSLLFKKGEFLYKERTKLHIKIT